MAGDHGEAEELTQRAAGRCRASTRSPKAQTAKRSLKQDRRRSGDLVVATAATCDARAPNGQWEFRTHGLASR